MHTLISYTDTDLAALSWGTVRILPYFADIYTDRFLPTLYADLYAQGALQRLFWDQPDLLIARSWTHFLAWVENVALFCVWQESDLVGLLALSQYVPSWQVHLSLWYARRARGELAWRATRTML